MTLPHKVKLRAFKALGRLALVMFRKRRQVAEVNIRICYPHLNDEEHKAFLRENFEHWGVALLEVAISWWGNDSGTLDNLTVIGAEHFEDAHAQERGVLVLGGHFLTIELGSKLFRKHFGPKIPIHIVHRLKGTPLFVAKVLKWRMQHVASCVRKEDTRQIVKLVRRKQVIWYAPDHDFGLNNSVFAPFFQHPAATLTTTSTLARLGGSKVVMMLHYRNPDDNGYTLQFFPPLDAIPSDDPLQDATLINHTLEQAIEKAPTQYMWMHRRFKTQPGLPRFALYDGHPLPPPESST